MDDGKFVKLTN